MVFDNLDLTHAVGLLEYCGVHRNCKSDCRIPKSCKELATKLANETDPSEMTEVELLVIINWRDYCASCNRCTDRCMKKIECERLMWKIVEDHKEEKDESK